MNLLFLENEQSRKPQLTQKIRVQVLAVGIGHSLEGRALLLHSQFQPVWIDGGYNNNPSLIDQLQKGNEEKRF